MPNVKCSLSKMVGIGVKPVARCPLPVARCPLPVARCPLPVAEKI